MKTRPLQFDFLKIILAGIIVSFPVQIMLLYGHPPWEVPAILAKISILNWLVISSCLYAIQLAHHADRKLLWFLPLTTALVGWNNHIVGYVGVDFSTTHTFLGTLAFASVNSIFLAPSVRFIFKYPNKRWWQTESRYKTQVQVFVNPLRGGEGFYTDTFDLSHGGTFIPLHDQQMRFFDSGEKLTLSFTLGTFRSLRCNAIVVRNAQANGMYPQGMGIKFLDLSRNQKDSLNQYFKANHFTQFRNGMTL